MNQIIKAGVDRGASDLHIKAGDAFRARIHGKLVALTKQALTPDQTKQIAVHLMPDEDKPKIDSIKDYDCSWYADGIGRFRVNIMRQRGSFMIVMRVIPLEVPTFEKLQLPMIMARIAELERGMILVTGVTGSGKSSTMAAMVNYMNQHSNRHILTLENPIEFLHKDINCAITQREIGNDTSDFKQGLKSALRQDPDVIMIGEMRDAETIEIALTAAETGHLVFSTLHTIDAAKTVDRIVGSFDPGDQAAIRTRLAATFRYFISQRLIRKKEGGRLALLEILKSTMRTREYVERGENEDHSLVDAMKDGALDGMQHFDGELERLTREGVITFTTAMLYATNAGNLRVQMADVADDEQSLITT